MNQKTNRIPSLLRRGETGQALVEYALILVLVSMALIAALIATGPAIANVFSNTVCNLVGLEDCSPDSLVEIGGGPDSFWMTVTWVAANPPLEEPIPPKTREPDETEDPSITAEPTEEPPEATLEPSPTEPPTSTPQDLKLAVPHYDPINEPVYWRVDNSVYLGGEDWWGEYYPNRDLQGDPEPAPAPPRTKGGIWNHEINPVHKYNINFNWGAGAPLGWQQTDNFSVKWTRTVYAPVDQSVTVVFTIQSIGGVRFWVDGVNRTGDSAWTNRTFNDAPVMITESFAAGSVHTLQLDYFSGTGDAAVYLDINAYKGNVQADLNLQGGGPNCQWTRITGSQPNSVAWAWKESPGGTGAGFPSNMRCHLELRGAIVLQGKNFYKMSFWDVWDLQAGDTVKLQIARYAEYTYLDNGTPDDKSDDTVDPASGPDWNNGTTTVLHSGGKNYGWTYNVVDIPAALYGEDMAFRFVLESGSGAGPRRWYVDDIVVDEFVRPKDTFTVCYDDKTSCGNYWDLNDNAQKDDFIYSMRWALRETTVVDGSSWDAGDSNGAYVKFGPEQPPNNPPQAGDERVHSLEFNGQVVFESIDQTGNGGRPDFEGNTGTPILSFSQAYNIESGTKLVVQYTRDAYDHVPDNWQAVGDLLAAGPAINTTMQNTEVDLSVIPNWWNSPFRLRFAMLVDGTVTPTVPGWQIDNIAFMRKGIPRFSAYPFCDGADAGGTGMENWLSAGGWGVVAGGVSSSQRAFTDSPSGNYRHGMETWMELKYPIDFNNNTTENVNIWQGNKDCMTGAAGGEAIDPILVFWHKRNLANNEAIYVDVMRPAHKSPADPSQETARINWTPVWSYTYNSRTGTNLAWERVEINMREAILNTLAANGTSLDWTGLKNSANLYDDDFSFRIRLDARSNDAVADGVYVDGIEIRNASEVQHRLWPNGGDGNRYEDDIEDWGGRWRTGAWTGTDSANWTGVSMPSWWKSHSAAAALTESSPTTAGGDFRTSYAASTFSVVEMSRIINLANTNAGDDPTLYFWNHYDVGEDAAIRVQVAVEDAARKQMGYDYIFGWGSDDAYANGSSWETLGEWERVGPTRVDTWIREQISLRDYVGKRIRLRFVVDAFEAGTDLADGWYVDDLVLVLRNPSIMPFPFIDQAKDTQNWITEGIWGIDPHKSRGSTGTPADMGPDKWHGYFVDCHTMLLFWPVARPCTTNGNPTTADSILNGIPSTVTAMNNYVSSRSKDVAVSVLSDTINYNFGTNGRPPGATGDSWSNDYVGRWIRTVSLPAGTYTFTIRSDQGVRMRYEKASAADTQSPYNWNILDNWDSHTLEIDQVNVTFDGSDYNVVIEWYEGTGPAEISLDTVSGTFSFTDSPPASKDVPVNSVLYGNSSLLLNGVLNLNKPSGLPAAQWKPGLRFYTLYDLDVGSNAFVEMSLDGGLTWIQDDLGDLDPCPAGAVCKPTILGGTDPDWTLETNPDWQLRALDLAPYSSHYVVLRFRLQTAGLGHDGWWVTDITVNNFNSP